MAKKKVYRLKRPVKIFFVVIVLLGVLGVFGYQKYKEYAYTQTFEYKFLNTCAPTKSENEVKKCYTMDEYKLFSEKLNDEEMENLLKYDYNEFIPKFVNEKYFLYKNLDGYLSQVITQEDDFFKYHGTDGYDYSNLVALTNTLTNNPYYENTSKTNIDKNYSMLVNKYHYLDKDYVPDDLVAIDWKYRLGGKDDIKQARKDVVDAFISMWESAKAENIYLLVDSGYRAYDKQESVYNEYQESKGTKFADNIAARPGYSEHQTGLAIDIYSKECTSASTFKDSKTYAWLMDNADKYGFILRYPKGKEKLTGYNYESWHYRYVGVELASKIKESGLTYDEYYAFYFDD